LVAARAFHGLFVQHRIADSGLAIDDFGERDSHGIDCSAQAHISHFADYFPQEGRLHLHFLVPRPHS
jgi:hypothetical protein